MKTNTHVLDAIVVEEHWRVLYFAAIGSAAGFLGSLVKLVSNIIGASAMGVDPLRLLRVYGTIVEGRNALLPNNGTSLLDTFLMHLIVGAALGAVFMLVACGQSRLRQFFPFLAQGAGFGLAIWIINFYLLLSWIQPLVNGEAYVVKMIPWWVAAGSHTLYGLTVALLCFPFRDDIGYPRAHS
jgi:hypothetical protein